MFTYLGDTIYKFIRCRELKEFGSSAITFVTVQGIEKEETERYLIWLEMASNCADDVIRFYRECR